MAPLVPCPATFASMERTPIKIPGKRKPRINFKRRSDAGTPPGKTRGRPLKLDTRRKTPTTPSPNLPIATSAKKRTMKNMKAKLKMSNLEKLPTELLERVFLYSMNLDLPRSSPVIAGKLSSEYIYIQTTIAAFAPTWGRTFTRDRSVATLQSLLLRCRWASLSIILKSQTSWVEQYAPNRKYTATWFIADDESLHATDMTPEDFFNANFARFTHFHLMDELHTTTRWQTFSKVDSDTEVPESLLLGPWSEDMIKHLFWLVDSGATVDFVRSTNGESAIIGLRKAISAGETRIIQLLLRACTPGNAGVGPIIYALRNAGGNKLQVINLVMMIYGGTGQNILQKKGSAIEMEIVKIEEEAETDSDPERLDFIRRVKESTWYDVLNRIDRYGYLRPRRQESQDTEES